MNISMKNAKIEKNAKHVEITVKFSEKMSIYRYEGIICTVKDDGADMRKDVQL